MPWPWIQSFIKLDQLYRRRCSSKQMRTDNTTDARSTYAKVLPRAERRETLKMVIIWPKMITRVMKPVFPVMELGPLGYPSIWECIDLCSIYTELLGYTDTVHFHVRNDCPQCVCEVSFLILSGCYMYRACTKRKFIQISFTSIATLFL